MQPAPETPEPPEGHWVTIADGAKMVNRSKRMIYRWIEQDRIQAYGGCVWTPDLFELADRMSRRRGRPRQPKEPPAEK
ncbi:DNA-binding protein [Mycetocola tolaasinivorans]|uniref:DNA-binding protein n=1 Tax=Mycetocola tolaasinivorans TaxID=76635 RepID=A0A3L7A8Z1_9MICO|nr:helix-turn-helix domain-containing protein [Mycetocola tolaasinivorans]RLP76318.1 DNA-binding protein [Mycetocola tolaasinivorans]